MPEPQSVIHSHKLGELRLLLTRVHHPEPKTLGDEIDSEFGRPSLTDEAMDDMSDNFQKETEK